MIEELEKALTCFRTAVRMDPRHYNAWYGIGLTYYKQERFQLTEIYYRKALGLNPYNPILMCHVAVVRRRRASLVLFSAESLSPEPGFKCAVFFSSFPQGSTFYAENRSRFRHAKRGDPDVSEEFAVQV